MGTDDDQTAKSASTRNAPELIRPPSGEPDAPNELDSSLALLVDRSIAVGRIIWLVAALMVFVSTAWRTLQAP